MKKILENGIGILIIVLVLYILFLHQCRGKDYWIPENQVLVNKTTWDSIEKKYFTRDSLIYIHDSFEVKEPVYITHDSLIYIEDSTGIKHYPDSLVNDSIRIWDDLYVKGIITKWDRRYEPVIHTIETKVTVTVPQLVEVPVYNSDNGLYPSLIMGGNSNTFIFGAGIDLITKKDFMYGFQYQRFGNENFYSIRFGAKLKIFKHKN
jgi:hypothetical protein